MKLVQLLFLAFALPMFLSMHLFSLILVFVSTFPDRYQGGGYQYEKCPLSCSIFLLLVSFTPVSLSSYCSFAPSFALYFFQTPSLCPCFWEWPFLTPRGKPLVFQPLQERLQEFVGETVLVGWLQRELVHAANWHLLFGSCLFKCCKGFLRMAN